MKSSLERFGSEHPVLDPSSPMHWLFITYTLHAERVISVESQLAFQIANFIKIFILYLDFVYHPGNNS